MNILSNVIVDLLGYNNPEEREIYKYGVQILLSDLSNFLIIIVPSLIFNKYWIAKHIFHKEEKIM